MIMFRLILSLLIGYPLQGFVTIGFGKKGIIVKTYKNPISNYFLQSLETERQNA